MRVLICGDRNWKDDDTIETELSLLHKKHKVDLVIEGGANGADLDGRASATLLGIPVMEFPANWDYYKKAAGPIRNSWMIKFGQPDLVLAFHSDIQNSKGTKDMVVKARKAGIKVRIIK